MRFSYYKRPLFLLLLCWTAAILVCNSDTRAGAFLRSASGKKAPGPRAGPGGLFPLPEAGSRLEGRVAQYPVRSGGLWRFALELSSVDGAAADTSVMAYARDMGGASYGDRISFTAGLSEPFNHVIPGTLDWRNYLSGRGISAEARGARPLILAKAPFPLGAAAAFRGRALKILEKNLGAEGAAVMSGVVLGEKKSVSENLKAAFQDSGAMHLLVASGSNVGFVTFLVYFICARFGIGKKYSGLAALCCAGFYVLVAGLEAPLVRGYIMFSAVLLGYLLDRDSGVFQGLVIACFAILLLEPVALFDAGFQMSFVASYGIAVGMTLWDGSARAATARLGLKGPALSAARILLVSVFAQAGLYPLMALYFHKISLVSVFSNIFLVPASGIIMGLGFAVLLLPWPPALASFVTVAAALGVDVFIRLVKFFAAFRFSSVPVSPPSALTLASFAVLVFVLLHAPLLGFRRRRLYVLAVAPLCALLAASLRSEKSVVSAFCDADTRAVLVRGGGGLFLFNPGVSGRKCADAARSYGHRELEGVFLSTLARRNWSGLEELGGLASIKKVVLPYGPRQPELEAVLAGLEAGGARVVRAWPGEIVPFRKLEARPDWPSGPGALYRIFGYTGLIGEGLDWSLSAPGFETAVRAGGSRITVKGAAVPGGQREIANLPGEAVEIKF